MKILNIILLSLIMCSASFWGYAQNSDALQTSKHDFLKGLTKAGPNDLDPSKQIMFDGESIPVYSPEGLRLQGQDLMDAMMSGNYIPEPYIDGGKEIKVFVLRLASPEEKERMKQMQQNRVGEVPKNESIGKEAKSFSVTDINGKTISLQELKGKVVVLNFWFVECKPCVNEIPELNKIVEEYKGKDVVFLGFATNEKSKIETFLQKTEFNYNIIPKSRPTAKEYGVASFPTHFVIDKNSIIAFTAVGLGPTTIDDIKRAIDISLNK